MNAAKQYFKTSNPVTSTQYYNLRILNSVSPCARLLFIEMRRLSGLNGYISKSIRELSFFIGKSARQVSRLVHELESNKLIEIWQHEGFENEYVICDVYFRHTHDKCVRTFKSKTSKELTVSRPKPDGISSNHRESNPCLTGPAGIDEQTSIELGSEKNDFHDGDPAENPDSIATLKTPSEPVIEPKKTHISMGKSSRTNPVRMDLVREIINLTHDHKSVRFWIKVVRSTSESVVQMAIHSLKSALQSETVYHAGRYLVGILKRLCPNMFDTGHKKQSVRPDEQCPDPSYYPKAVVNEPQIERNEELNLSSIQAIRALLAKREQLCQA